MRQLLPARNLFCMSRVRYRAKKQLLSSARSLRRRLCTLTPLLYPALSLRRRPRASTPLLLPARRQPKAPPACVDAFASSSSQPKAPPVCADAFASSSLQPKAPTAFLKATVSGKSQSPFHQLKVFANVATIRKEDELSINAINNPEANSVYFQEILAKLAKISVFFQFKREIQ